MGKAQKTHTFETFPGFAGMSMGSARVDLAALIELNRLATGGDKPAFIRSGRRVALDKDDETSQHADAGYGSRTAPTGEITAGGYSPSEGLSSAIPETLYEYHALSRS